MDEFCFVFLFLVFLLTAVGRKDSAGAPGGTLLMQQIEMRTHARLYGIDLPSNYQGQGLKLSKHFKS